MLGNNGRGERILNLRPPWSRTMKTKNSKCFIWCRFREQPISFSLAQLSRSCTELYRKEGLSVSLSISYGGREAVDLLTVMRESLFRIIRRGHFITDQVDRRFIVIQRDFQNLIREIAAPIELQSA